MDTNLNELVDKNVLYAALSQMKTKSDESYSKGGSFDLPIYTEEEYASLEEKPEEGKLFVISDDGSDLINITNPDDTSGFIDDLFGDNGDDMGF